jgi:hypothetical protein
MEKKFKSFQALASALGYEEYKIYYLELVNANGLKGAKVVRVENMRGEKISLKEFLAKHKLDPTVLGVDFVGIKGWQFDGKIKTIKIKFKSNKQETQEEQ